MRVVVLETYYGSGGMNTKPSSKFKFIQKKRVDKARALGLQ